MSSVHTGMSADIAADAPAIRDGGAAWLNKVPPPARARAAAAT